MCNKLIGPIVLILLLGWVSVSPAQGFDPDTDPSLIGWWAFDEGSGTTAADSSGNGNDGTLNGDPEWVDGFAPAWVAEVSGTALEFDGVNDYVGTGEPLLDNMSEFTLAGWIVAGNPTASRIGLVGQNDLIEMGFNGGNMSIWAAASGTTNASWTLDNVDWHHFAVVATSSSMTIYLDGVQAGSGTGAADYGTSAYNVNIGGGGIWDTSGNWFQGKMDDVRIYSRALTAAEVKVFIPPKLKAYNPIPADGASGVVQPLLQWTKGDTALFHDVYLGTTPELTQAELVSPRQTFPMYYHVMGLEAGTTYYWRVDEVEDNGTVHTGPVWTFSVPPSTAWTPTPADGSLYEDVNVNLSWMAGKDATRHEIYFSTSEDDVVNGADTAFQIKQGGTTFDPGTLERGTVYYWRVDEVQAGGAVTAGEVWSFRTIPVIAIDDPDLMGWWKLDEGQGMTAVDWSGHDNHGELMGDPLWIGGFQGDALEFDGSDDYVDTGYAEDLAEWTLSCWVISPAAPAATSPTGPIHREQNCQINWNHSGDAFRGSAALSVEGTWYSASLGQLLGDTWYHLAATYDGAVLNAYKNGELITTTSCPGAPAAETNTLKLARHAAAAQYFAGTVDDARIYSRALALEEIQEVMRGDTTLAWNPQPASGKVVDIRDITSVRWSAGDTAAQHDVYIGTDRDAVRGADTSSPEYMGRQGSTSFAIAGIVEFGGGAYFWRIDEVEAGGTVRTGSVWKFTVPDYLLVDDFESYSNDAENLERVFQTWIDGLGYNEPTPGKAGNGSGALVGHDIWDPTSPYYQGQIVEVTDVHGGGTQAMPLYFDNSVAPFKSEADRTWATPQDMTVAGVTDLSLWFKGAPAAFIQTAADSFTISASGEDIWTTADQFRFAYKSLNGNGSIVARVDSIANTNAWAKGGVMIRESLDPGAKHAMVVVTPGNGVQFTWRQLMNMDMTEHSTQTGLEAPHWVRLTRAGNVFTAEHSADGVTWEPVVDAASSTHELPMIGNVYIGLALTSHNANAVTVAEFSNVTTSGGVSGQWQVAEVGGVHPANGQADFYVALQDSAGRIADVPYPGGANVADWTEWEIPLTDFSDAGVNLAAIKKMTLGVGNRTAPVADGDGLMLIDDIRVVLPAPVDPNEAAGQ